MNVKLMREATCARKYFPRLCQHLLAKSNCRLLFGKHLWYQLRQQVKVSCMSLRSTWKGQCFMSLCTAGSSNIRPMKRFASAKKHNKKFCHSSSSIYQPACAQNSPKIVLLGFIATWLFCCITDQYFVFCEGNIARCGAVSLVVRDNFHLSMLKDSNTGVRGTKIDANRRSF